MNSNVILSIELGRRKQMRKKQHRGSRLNAFLPEQKDKTGLE